MKIVIERRQLLLSLQRVQGVVEKRNTMPILSNVLIETTKKGIWLSATDLEIGLRGFCPCAVQDEGKVTLSAKKLYEIIREVPEGDISLSTEENHWTFLKAGRSQFKIKGLSADDFPQLPKFDDSKAIKLSSVLLQDLIRKTAFSCSEGDTRQILNGVLLEVVQEDSRKMLRMVGTDGHRLALAEKEIQEDFPRGQDSSRQIIIPKKAVLELRRLLDESDEIRLGLMGNQIGVEIGQVVLFSRLLEGAYPNYTQVIPPQSEHALQINRSEFEGVLRRVALFSREKTHAIVMEINPGKALLTSQDPDVGEAKEDVAIDYSGPKVTVGFNAQYILEVISAIEDPILALEIPNALSPCLLRSIEGRSCLWVVMPLRLQEL